jgi:hypothetical protein
MIIYVTNKDFTVIDRTHWQHKSQTTNFIVRDNG